MPNQIAGFLFPFVFLSFSPILFRGINRTARLHGAIDLPLSPPSPREGAPRRLRLCHLHAAARPAEKKKGGR